MTERQVTAVREACLWPPELRTEEHINTIIEFAREEAFFARLVPLQQRALCRTMAIEEFAAKEVVFRIGDRGDKFYILLSGQVLAQAPSPTAPCPTGIHPDKCDCPNRPLNTVMFYKAGMGFGELALQNDQPRAATILCTSFAECLVVKRADFEENVGQMNREFIAERVRFLRQCPRIEDALQRHLVTTQDVAVMANCLNESSQEGCGIVARQGEPCDHMIFVRSGRLAMVRVVDNEAVCRDALASKANARKEAIQRQTNGAGSSVEVSPIGPAKRKRPQKKAAQPVVALEPAAEFSVNLAKDMLALRRKERNEKLQFLQQSSLVVGDPEIYMQTSTGSATMVEPASSASLASARRAKVEVGQLVLPTESTPSSSTPKNAELWGKLKGKVNQANVLKIVASWGAEPDPPKPAQKKASKFRMRQQATQAAKVEQEESEKGRVSFAHFSKEVTEEDRPTTSGSASKKKVLLRIGTLSPNQYFGEHQVSQGSTFPVSLVSDPVAELYFMTKHDILRRLPKKLFSALFEAGSKDPVPSDAQLWDMHNQSRRWDSFRWSMHGQASSSRKGVNARSNLEFMGVNPNLPSLSRVVAPPTPRRTSLTAKDEEHFSQSSARFLRRFKGLRDDPGLRAALVKDGHHQRRHIGETLSDSDDDQQDPMSFHFNLHWSNFRKPILLDINGAEEVEVPTIPADQFADEDPASFKPMPLMQSFFAGSDGVSASDPRTGAADVTISLSPTRELEASSPISPRKVSALQRHVADNLPPLGSGVLHSPAQKSQPSSRREVRSRA